MLAMKSESYTVRLSARSRVHVYFERDKKKVVDFTVNCEIFHKKQKKWIPILRYDTAHDHLPKQKYKMPHKHILHNKRTEVIIKIRMRDYNQALTIAYEDIHKNFRRIKYNFFI